jgi:hypothetical protein
MFKITILESQLILKCLAAIKPKGLNNTDKIGNGHLCLREENLSQSLPIYFIRYLFIISLKKDYFQISCISYYFTENNIHTNCPFTKFYS